MEREHISFCQRGTEGTLVSGPVPVRAVDVRPFDQENSSAACECTFFLVRDGQSYELLGFLVTAGGARYEQSPAAPLALADGESLRWETKPPTDMLVWLNKRSDDWEPAIPWLIVDPILKPLVVDETASHRKLPPKADTATVTKTTERSCPYPDELDDDVMSNYDHRIDEAVAERLKETVAFTRYSGWNFNGRVWWARDVNRWRCEVWQYGCPVAIVEAPELGEIMAEVCERWGYD